MLKNRKCASGMVKKRALVGALTAALVIGNLTLPANISVGGFDFGAVFAQAAEKVDSGTCGEDLKWVLDDEGVLTISGNGEMENYSLVIYLRPWYYEDKSIVSAVIKDGVTSIGDCSFYYCTNLKVVDLPDSLTNIGEWAFCYCKSLTSIDIPDSVTGIGRRAFAYCENLTSVTFLGDAPEIAEDAFAGVAAIAYYPANNSTWTEEVMQQYGGEITWVAYAVDDEDGMVVNGTCGDNLTWTLNNEGVLTISGTGDMYNYEGLLSVPWRDYLGSISSVVIETGATSIGNWAFSYSSLTNIDIPDSVISIGNSAFRGCYGLADEDGFVIVKGALYDYYGENMDVEIPEGVTSIDESAFAYSDITSVEIPNSVTLIYDNAFEDCSSLTSIEIPSSVTSIGDYAFYECTSLTDVYYSGDEDGWNETEIGEQNDWLTSATIHFAVIPYDLSECVVTLEYNTTTYTGSALEPVVTVEDLTEGTDYTVSYENNTNAGTATVTVTGIGNNAGSYVTSFEITKVDQSVTASIETESIAYGGTSQITATGVGAITYSSSDESVATVNDMGLVSAVSAGNATITITAAGDSNTNSLSTAINVSVEEEEITYVLGDINEDGFIDYLDAMTALRFDAELIELTDEQRLAGDVNGDGSVDSLDAILILRFDAGLVVSFAD